MRLYLEAKSKNQIGYTPDWVQILYTNEDGADEELVLDIRGDISYDKDGINCCVKGNLVPWVLRNLTDNTEIDLEELEEDVIAQLYPPEKIINIFKKGKKFRVGIYPISEFENEKAKLKDDCLSDCVATYEFNNGVIQALIDFEFETETY